MSKDIFFITIGDSEYAIHSPTRSYKKYTIGRRFTNWCFTFKEVERGRMYFNQSMNQYKLAECKASFLADLNNFRIAIQKYNKLKCFI
jgi:hypothetical protein